MVIYGQKEYFIVD
jgi:hypothetical protein